MGFSTRTSIPAAINCRATGTCNSVGVATTAASTRPGSSRTSVMTRAPKAAASFPERSWQGSRTATSATPGRPVATRAWFVPMIPEPITARRTGAAALSAVIEGSSHGGYHHLQIGVGQPGVHRDREHLLADPLGRRGGPGEDAGVPAVARVVVHPARVVDA